MKRSEPGVALIAIALLVPACGAPAQTKAQASIADAKPGSTIVLPPGDAGILTLDNLNFSPAITIDASPARITGLVVSNSSGIAVIGGKIIGPGGRSYGVSINRSRQVSITGMDISGAHRGVVVNVSSDIVLADNRLHALLSDGIDVGLSRRVRIERNSCSDFHPALAQFTPGGVRIKDGDHPDCIQVWSRPSESPSADISITGNTVDGVMQGIFLGDHVRNGVSDGGFDRVTIRDNIIHAGFYHGILVDNARNSVVRNNTVTSLGIRSPKPPYRVMRASIHLTPGIAACGNRVDGDPRAPGQGRC